MELLLADTLVQEIMDDRVRGSTELALRALDGIGQIVRSESVTDVEKFQKQILTLLVRLQTSRPSMVALFHLLERVRLAAVKFSTSLNSDNCKARWINACLDAATFAEEAQSETVQRMAGLIEADDVIMTHSVSSTLKKVFDELVRRGILVRIFVTESRPRDEGKLLAEYLVGIGIKTAYITEAQINLFMPEVNKVLVGADAVLADGSIINKCGTSLMAMSAQYHQVPVYVCAESFKRVDGIDYVLEQMAPEELKLDVPGVEVFNSYFEKVAPDLITQWIR